MRKSERILALILMLRKTHSGLGIREIARDLGISERTVYRDLGSINEVYRGFFYVSLAEGRYRLSREAEAPPIALTNQDIAALRAVSEGTPGLTPHAQRVKQAISKVLAAHAGAREEDDHPAALTVFPPQVRDLVDWRVLRDLEKAVQGHRELRIRYFSFHRGETWERPFQPYALVFRKNAWYVIGFLPADRAIRTLRAGRIQWLRRTGRRFNPPGNFSVESYFAASWEVFKGDPVKIRLVFSARLAPLIGEMRWHPKQKVERVSDGRLFFTVEVPVSPELKAWILSWGSHCEVLEPKLLRDEVGAEAEKLNKVYKPPGTREATRRPADGQF
ncbi:MAG: WYL domain-containing protein [Planctomycetes bacterium]|nr:WYL domain-containing protein [Planctomycetota bacterium]